MLVVVEYWYIALFFQLALYFKATWRSYILKVYTAEGAGNKIYRVYEFVNILCLYAYREGIHTAKFLEEHALALHYGHTGLRTYIAKPQHRAAVGYYGADVPSAGQVVAFADILLYFKTGLRHAGGIGEGKLMHGLYRHRRVYFYLPLPFFMQPERFFCVIHFISPVSQIIILEAATSIRRRA